MIYYAVVCGILHWCSYTLTSAHFLDRRLYVCCTSPDSKHSTNQSEDPEHKGVLFSSPKLCHNWQCQRPVSITTQRRATSLASSPPETCVLGWRQRGRGWVGVGNDGAGSESRVKFQTQKKSPFPPCIEKKKTHGLVCFHLPSPISEN